MSSLLLLLGLLLLLDPTIAWTLGRSQFLQLLTTTTLTTLEEDVCRNDALVPEQAIPGAYSQVCMSLPERVVPLIKGGENIVIRQEASGSGRTGMAVWNSGLLLTRLLQALVTELPNWQPQSVLELGCGTGLVSIAASRLWKSASVTATDGNPDVVRLADTNLQVNHCDRVQAEVLQWGLLNAMEYSDEDEADLVLGADLTYNSGTWRVLAETMVTIVKPEGYILYLSLGHEGFNVNAEVDGFLSVAKEVGLVTVNEMAGVPVSNLLESILTVQEASQLQQSGGARVVVLRRKLLSKKSR
jgi:SAM-dependent methyltransferase